MTDRPIFRILKTEIIYRLRVRIGIEERNQEGGFEEIDVIKMIPHETYIPGPEFKNDIALLKLERAYKDNKGTCSNY